MKIKKKPEVRIFNDGVVRATYFVEYKGVKTIWDISNDWFVAEPYENPYWNSNDDEEEVIKKIVKSKFLNYINRLKKKQII